MPNEQQQQWDDRAAADREFPAERYVRVNVMTADAVRQIVCRKAFESNRPSAGQVRWFGPRDGTLYYERSAEDQPYPREVVGRPRRKTLVQRLRAMVGV